jgi:hypothetical protein
LRIFVRASSREGADTSTVPSAELEWRTSQVPLPIRLTVQRAFMRSSFLASLRVESLFIKPLLQPFLQCSQRLGERVGPVILAGQPAARLPDLPLQVLVENVKLVTFL